MPKYLTCDFAREFNSRESLHTKQNMGALYTSHGTNNQQLHYWHCQDSLGAPLYLRRALWYYGTKSKQTVHFHIFSEWMCNTAREIEAATQPLCQRGWTSHSATLAERLTQPLWQSGWVAAADTQPLSHSGRAADAATQPLSQSERLTGWVAGEPLECKQCYPDLIFLRSG